jgi:hypothetical protein
LFVDKIKKIDQLESTQIQHEIELKSLESRYTRKLNEQQDIISNLKDQVDFLIANRQAYRKFFFVIWVLMRCLLSLYSHTLLLDDEGDTDSYISIDENEEEQDNQSIISSIYDV